MTQSGGSWLLKLTATIAMSGAVITSSGNCTLAQITPDGSLGAERSTIKRDVKIKGLPGDRIDGGTKRGANLFHSFRDFNISEGQRAYFANPRGIKNILGRVTGKNRSDIQGTLGVLGEANLFLINPNGIIFGPNASLDVEGSFVGTTTNAVGLANGDIFSTNLGEPLPAGLLNVNPNVFLFNQLVAQSTIKIQSRSGLEVDPGRSLLLLGGDVSLNGGTLQAPAGRVELGAVAEKGTVGLKVDDNNLGLNFPDDVQRADISLSNQASVNVNGERGGSVQIQGRRVTVADESTVFANTLGNQNGGEISIHASQLSVRGGAQVSTSTLSSGQGGNLSVTADTIELVDTSADGKKFPSGFRATTRGTGDAGDLKIETGSLSVRGGAQISTSTFSSGQGAGQGGNLSVTADTIELVGESADGKFPSGLLATTRGTGDAGDLKIETGSLSVRGGARLSTSTLSSKPGAGQGGSLSVTADTIELVGESADGEIPSRLLAVTRGARAAGDLKIETGRLSVRGGAQVSTSTLSSGQGGSLSVTADTIELVGESADGKFPSGFRATTRGTGDAGDLKIETGSLSVRGGAQISTSTFSPKLKAGQGGSLSVTTSDIELVGTSADGEIPSGLLATTRGAGPAGNLRIETGSLSVRGGARLSTSTLSSKPGAGQGGSLSVTANDIELVGTSADGEIPSSLRAATRGTGDAGDLKIVTTGQLAVRNGAEIIANSAGNGAAGNIKVSANSIRLDNKAFIRSDTTGGQGNIFLRSQDLILSRGSNVTTDATETATGGNININTGVLVALDNSDISANALEGPGGQVTINAQGIFGTAFREIENRATSDITATSELGPEFSGTVDLNTPDVDPSQGVVALPEEVVDVSGLIAQTCPAGSGPRQSKFVVTGRGGVPPNPGETLSTDAVQVGLVTLNPNLENRSSLPASTNPTSSSVALVVEAQGWVRDVNGNVVLTANAPAATPHSSWGKNAKC